MVRTCVKFALAASALAFSSTAWALDNYVPYIPNGNVNTCLNCHMTATGGDARNPFGHDVEVSRVNFLPRWTNVFDLDSDGDGYTNGEELGDPCGVFVRNQVPPPITMGITLPGNPESHPTEHTIAMCNGGGSSSAGGGSSSSSSGGGGVDAGAVTAPDAGGGNASSSESSSSGGSTTGGGGCCGGGNSAARVGDLSLLALFALVLRFRRR